MCQSDSRRQPKSKLYSFSKRTVNLLSDFDKSDADLFTKLCGFGWVIANVVPLVFDIQADIYNRNGIDFDTLNHLETIELIQFGGLADFKRIGVPKRFAVYYYGKPLSLKIPEDANNELKIGKVFLTKIGQELAPICGSNLWRVSMNMSRSSGRSTCPQLINIDV